jgi:sulfur carrier protein ThiS
VLLLRCRSVGPAACGEHLSVLAKPARAETLPSGAGPISQTKSVGHTLSSTGSGLPGVAVAQNSDVVLVHSNDAVRLLSVVDGSVMQTVAAR